MTVKETLHILKEKMNSNPGPIESVTKVYQFNLTGNEDGVYQILFSQGTVDYTLEATAQPDCTLTLSDKNFLKLVAGDLNPTMAFMSGKLKIDGSMGLALKLQGILKEYQ